jgi:maltose O-acetyltransferase
VKRIVERYRRRIDRLDRRVARLLSKRFQQVLRIGRAKQEHNVEVTDRRREIEVLDRIGSVVKDERARRFVHSIYGRIFEESSRIQREEQEWTGK